MRRFSNGCDQSRESISLLASGALASSEKAAVENHLAACSGCRKYYEEVRSIAQPFADWEKTFSHLEPEQAVQSRWADEFKAATQSVSPARLPLHIFILDWCRDMIWPCRRIWAGFAAIWVVMIAINFSTQESYSTMAGNSSRPSLEMVKAYLEAEGFFAERSKLDENLQTPPVKSSPPLPRSERRARVYRA